MLPYKTNVGSSTVVTISLTTLLLLSLILLLVGRTRIILSDGRQSPVITLLQGNIPLV